MRWWLRWSSGGSCCHLLCSATFQVIGNWIYRNFQNKHPDLEENHSTQRVVVPKVDCDCHPWRSTLDTSFCNLVFWAILQHDRFVSHALLTPFQRIFNVQNLDYLSELRWSSIGGGKVKAPTSLAPASPRCSKEHPGPRHCPSLKETWFQSSNLHATPNTAKTQRVCNVMHLLSSCSIIINHHHHDHESWITIITIMIIIIIKDFTCSRDSPPWRWRSSSCDADASGLNMPQWCASWSKGKVHFPSEVASRT